MSEAIKTLRAAKTVFGIRPRVVIFRALVLIGAIATFVCLLLFIGSVKDDVAIESRLGKATAEVVSVSFQRTVVRFATPDGQVISPPQGILYPSGLAEGQLVRVEYDTANPELTRVAERTAALAIVPISTFLLLMWAALGPLIWWTRRKL